MATVPADPLKTLQLVELPITSIFPHSENPRRITDDHPSLPGLAESIRETGLINPITVRENSLVDGKYEILAGERRYRAAKLAGLTRVACRVLDVTDEQAFHIITVENLQREDLHWLEEARGVEAMVKRGWDLATIGKHIGKSEAWVRLRAKLATISPAWRKAVEDPKGEFRGWPAAMLELVARFPIETQETLLRGRTWELARCQSTAALQKYLDVEITRALKSAPWDLGDAKLVAKAGACTACPKRSSCQQQLFAEVKEDRCLDATCWQAKAEAHVIAGVAAVKKEHPKAIVVGTSYEAPKALQKQVQSEYDYRQVKPDAKGAVPAVFATGEKAGQLVYVAKGAERGGRAASPASTSAPKEKPPKARLAEFMKRRARKRINAVLAKLGGNPDASPYQARYAKVKDPASDVGRPDTGTLVAFALAHGLPNDAQTRDWPAFQRFMDTDESQLDTLLWRDIRQRLVQVLGFDAAGSDADDRGAMAIAETCGLNWNEITAAARDALPLPKTLAEHFDEDGRPLKGLTAKAKPPAKSKAKAAAAKA